MRAADGPVPMRRIGEQAVQLGIDKCGKHGVSAIALRHSGHLGRIGDWPQMAAEAGKFSLHYVNTSGKGLLVAPFGGIERRMSANPIAAGVVGGIVGAALVARLQTLSADQIGALSADSVDLYARAIGVPLQATDLAITRDPNDDNPGSKVTITATYNMSLILEGFIPIVPTVITRSATMTVF